MALLSVLKANKPLRQQFITFLLFVGIFQGFFNVSRVALPTDVLHLSSQYVGLLQIISSSSALVGAILFYVLNKQGIQFGNFILRLLSLSSLIAMCFATLITNVSVSYILYFIFMFLFELLFFKYQADVVNACPKEHMPLIATFQYTGAYAAMLLVIFLGGVITQKIGLAWAAVIFSVLYLVIMFTEFLQTTKKSAQVNFV